MAIGSRQPRGGIERKILTSILWVGIMPMTIALGAGIITALDWQSKSVQSTLARSAKKTANELRLSYEARMRTLRSLATTPDIVEALVRPQSDSPPAYDYPERMAQLARRINRGLGEHDVSSVYSLHDREGTLVTSTSPTYQRDLRPRELGSTAVDDRFRIVENTDEGVIYVVITAPVMDPNGSSIFGYVAETISLANVLESAFDYGAPREPGDAPEDVFQLVYTGPDDKSLVAYLTVAPDGQGPLLRTAPAAPGLMRRLTVPGQSGSGVLPSLAYHGPAGEQRVMLAYNRMFAPRNDIFVIVYRPAFKVFSTIQSWALKAVSAGFLLIAFLCINAYRYVHNNIVRPISLLNEGAQIIRQGDLDLKLKIHTGDELEELASSFNKMALALSRNTHQLEESEERYRSLITSMRDGVYQTETDDVLTFLNPAGLEIFGYRKAEEVLGKCLRELFLEEIDYARLTSMLESKGYIERTRVWMRHVDGRSICIEIAGNRVYDDEGQPLGAEGIFRDVTLSVKLEQEARERQERIVAINQIANVINSSLESGRLYENLAVELKKLVDFDYAAVTLLDDDAAQLQERRLWPERDKGMAQRYPVTPEDSCAGWVIHHDRYLLVHNFDDRARWPEGFGSALSCLSDQFPEGTRSCLCVPLYAMERAIGTLNLASTHASSFDRHDVEVLEQMAPHVAVAIGNVRLLDNLNASLREVTTAREDLHRANEELKTLDEMKTNLLSNVSHELRTPLVSVMGYTDMIYNGKAGPITQTQKDYLAISLRNIERLVTLIENLLDFSRLHRGAERLLFDTFDLVDCAQASMQVVRPVADSRDITLELNASDDTILVEGDKGKLGQVFNNLLSNAVKFNHNGGRVTVDIAETPDATRVEVSDTGIGIPEEALERVFTRFYQYDGSSTRKYGGTGIGLSIALDIARLHGTSINVRSVPGEGSTFSFSLPKARSRRDVTAEEAGLPLPAQTHQLVELVSPDRALGAQIRELVNTEGMDMIHAVDVSYAVSLAQKHRPDGLLVDVDSLASAPTTLDFLLENTATADLPLVIITNDDDLYFRYRHRVASRLRRSFRKSTLLSGLQRCMTPSGRLGDKILCVDDDPEILEFMSRCLEDEGYETVRCESGERAVELAATGDFCLVLLDLAMPGMDGWETARSIKALPESQGLKVYLVTAKPEGNRPQRLREAGVDGCFMKPFKPADLIELMQSLNIEPSGGDNSPSRAATADDS